MADPAKTVDQNILPVQALFNLDNSFNTFIGQGQPFYATVNPSQSGLAITNSTIDSSSIGANSPSTGVFTNILTSTGQVTTSPTANADIANKQYVDAIAQGLNPKQAVKCGTTANITLSGLQAIDGYTTLAGDRVLVKNQTSTPTNGIYIAASGAWTRAPDMDVWAEVPGAYMVVLNGSTNGNTGWVSTSSDAGTIDTTPITFVQFSGNGTYFAGTGLTLASNTFSITNTGTAGIYGSASSVPVLTTNAQGQVTSVTPTAIAIAASQVTSGTIASSLISGSYTGITGVGTLTVGTWNATPITNSFLANSSITINGNAVSLGGSTTVTANTPNALTFNNGGAGAASGTTFNGAAAQTISYNTIGSPSVTGTNASGTWGISISGNAATATNGLVSTGSYSNPTWLTSISGSIVSGAVASATLAASATNVAGGTAGALPYQTGSGATSFLGLGTTNYVLTAGAAAPQYVAQSTLSVGSAATATTATNLAGGGAGFVPYQSGEGATSFLSAGTTGQVLTSNGSGAPTWSTPATSVTLFDDTSTAAARYPLFASATSGSASTIYTSSTKYQYNPSTGVLSATGFSGSGASLTNLTAGNLSGTIPSGVLGNSTVYIGTTAVALNRASASISLTGTNIDGSAGSATTATTATNATNTAITDDTSSSATFYPTFVSNTTGNLPQLTSSTKLQYQPSTGTTISTIVQAGTQANYIQATGATTTKAVQFQSLGSDAAVSLAIQSKGTTGAIDLSAQGGVNISNGGTVTAITRTANGSGYTSIPSLAISAPTTAGGVQAVATPNMLLVNATVQSGGTGYTVADTLTVVGGTGAAAILTVSTVSSGAVTGVTINSGGFGNYSVLPTNPVSVTGGTGSGATFNLTSYGLSGSFTITNAGSGYVEQPTVTFSGGGGSGAAAYAVVGSVPKITSLGGDLSFYTPGGEGFRVSDIGATSVNYIAAQGATSSGNTPGLIAQGTSGTLNFRLSSRSSGALIFATNSNTQTQMQVTHTASAVNYVQVTGAATNVNPQISVQGSDATRGLILSTKAGGSLVVSSNSGTNTSFFVQGTNSSSLNYVQVQGTATGSGGPIISSQGPTDPNIDLTLTPKGTGVVRGQGVAVSTENGIFLNKQTVAASMTVATGYSAHSVGPITVATGQSVTLSSGSRWVIL